jgi:hypothetical protein
VNIDVEDLRKKFVESELNKLNVAERHAKSKNDGRSSQPFAYSKNGLSLVSAVFYGHTRRVNGWKYSEITLHLLVRHVPGEGSFFHSIV